MPGLRRRRELALVRLRSITAIGLALAVAGCSNDPYLASDRNQKILYSSFSEAPKTLDPAVAYTTASHIITGNVYDTLLEYHFLKRPYELMPALAESVPAAVPHPDGGVSYLFTIRDGILFHSDPCFQLSQGDGRSRKVTAADFAFELARLADPSVNSPLAGSFTQVQGFAAFAERLTAMRQADAAFAALPAYDQYKRAGGIAGVVVRGERELEVVLSEAKPQILYFFAMPFTTPVPWEAVAYYNGQQGREQFADHPVGTGPYRLAVYEKQYRMQLERNEAWYGSQANLPAAPGATFPREIDQQDIVDKQIDGNYAGRRLPFLERINFVREREDIPRFNKFLQGYYDEGHIIKESFDAVVQNDALSPQMAARGMRLDKTVEPSIFYIGFNMDDPVVGTAAGERGLKLRQAMSLVIDAKAYLELFLNGRGVLAQSPLPPGIFGYQQGYTNPFRQPDLARAQNCSPRPATATASMRAPAHRSSFPLIRRIRRPRPCCNISSTYRRGVNSGSMSKSTPPPTINSRPRCAAAPTSCLPGDGSPTFPIRKTFSSYSNAAMLSRRAADRILPTFATPSSIASTMK